MRTTPRVILILKQASSAARLHKTLAQKLHLTETILKIHSIKWENVFENLNLISYLSGIKKPKNSSFCYIFGPHED